MAYYSDPTYWDESFKKDSGCMSGIKARLELSINIQLKIYKLLQIVNFVAKDI